MSRLPTTVLLVLLSLLLLLLYLAINRDETPVPIHALQSTPWSTGHNDLVVVQSDRAFYFRPDPNLELLRYETFGGSAVRWTRSKLYANGHLRLELIWPGTGDVVETFDWQLDYGEVVRLVGLLVHSGFLESSEGRIADQLRNRYEDLHFGPISSHSAKSKLTLSLVHYRASGKRRMVPASNSIGLYAPSRLSREYPGLPELDSFAKVSEVFNGYIRQEIGSMADPDNGHSPQRGLDLAGITLSYSKDPEKVILCLAVMVPQTALYRSMGLYGDGRFLLAQLGSELEVLRSRELRLGLGEANRLLSIVGRSKLPEYDLDQIGKRVSQARGGEELNLFFGLDHATTIVEIALESYTNGSVSLNDVDTRIVLTGAGAAAARYPEIQEFQGVVELTDLIYARWEETFGSQW